MPTMELLQTKLQRPRVPHHFVPRPRLIERLDRGSQGPLTLVCAAAGYGKTTLVSSWIEGLAAGHTSATPQPVAWISLDERDSDLGLFLRYFIAGLRTVFPGACEATASLLQAPQLPPLNIVSAKLSNEIGALTQDFILVFDDQHAISGRAVPDLLRELQRHWPQPMHLVLISRHVPALSLDPWRAKGQVTEIRTHDLRFTPGEAAAYLEQALGKHLSQPAIDLLERRTEGWIAGLQLASLALRDVEDPEGMVASLSGSDAEFGDYLARDVLSHQPRAIQSFLLQTAILDHFCVALCEAVVSSRDPEWNARRCIDWLERRNLFVTSLDSHKEWYRYHQMFRSVLLRRSTIELGASRVASLHCSTAAWFASHGLVNEAIRHALAAGDDELAARFVVQGLCDVLNRDDRLTLERWLSLFTDEFIQNRLDLLIVRGFSLFFAWQLGALVKAVEHAVALLERETNETLPEVQSPALRACLAALSAAVAYFSGDPDAAVASSRKVLALAPEAWAFVRSAGMIFQGLGMQACGDGEAAVQFLIEEYESLGDRTSHYALRLLLTLCFVHYREAEDLEPVMLAARKMVEAAERSRLSLLQAWGHYLLGLAHYQRNELAAARQSFVTLLGFKYTGNTGAVRDGVQRLALIHQLAGEQAEAREMLQLLAQMDLDQSGIEANETGALRARLQLMGGEPDRAARWADGFAAPAPDQLWLWQDPPHLIKARILLARGTAVDLRSALEILDAFYKTAERTHNIRLKIEVLALRVLALGALGKAGEARDALQAAVDLAEPGGFLRVFLDLGAPMEEALGRLARQESLAGSAMARRILAEFSHQTVDATRKSEAANRTLPISTSAPTAGSARTQPLIEPLTRRELEILMLLRGPQSLKEIARQLCISYQTARRHMANIYGKLGVSKRSAAVARAEALRLIPPR